MIEIEKIDAQQKEILKFWLATALEFASGKVRISDFASETMQTGNYLRNKGGFKDSDFCMKLEIIEEQCVMAVEAGINSDVPRDVSDTILSAPSFSGSLARFAEKYLLKPSQKCGIPEADKISSGAIRQRIAEIQKNRKPLALAAV